MYEKNDCVKNLFQHTLPINFTYKTILHALINFKIILYKL
jgi:hypothetical protein